MALLSPGKRNYQVSAMIFGISGKAQLLRVARNAIRRKKPGSNLGGSAYYSGMRVSPKIIYTRIWQALNIYRPRRLGLARYHGNIRLATYTSCITEITGALKRVTAGGGYFRPRAQPIRHPALCTANAYKIRPAQIQPPGLHTMELAPVI